MIKVTVQDIVYDFFRANLGVNFSDDFRGCLYVPDGYRGEAAEMEHVAIAIGYNNFNGNLCSMHVVIQKPEFVTKKVVREVFEYPFVDAARTHVIAPVDSTNQAAIDFDKRLGFKEIHRFPEGGTDGDLVILAMSKDECRWLKKEA